MLRQVLKDSSLVLIGDAFTTFVAGFLLVPLYTHHMPTAEYGIVVTIVAIGSVLTPFLSFALGSALMRYYYEVPAERRPQYVGTLAVFLVLLVGATSGLWVGAADLLHHAFFANLPAEALLWALALVLSTPFRGLIDVILRVEGRFSTMVAAALGQSLLLVLGAYLLVGRYQLGLQGWVYTNLAAPVVTTLALAYVVRHQFRRGWMKPELTRSLRFSWPLVLGYLTWFLLNRSNIIILQSSRSLAEAGIFGVTYQFGLLLMVAGQAVDKVVGPLFYRDIGEPGGAQRWARLATVFVGLAAWLGLTLCLFCRPVFAVLFPAQYSLGLPALPLIIWAFLCKFFDLFLMRGLHFRERTTLVLTVSAIAGSLNLGLNVILVPRYGMMAAAATTLGCFALATTLALYLSQRVFYIGYAWGRLAPIVLTSAVASAVFARLDIVPWGWADWGARVAAVAATGALYAWSIDFPVRRGITRLGLGLRPRSAPS